MDVLAGKGGRGCFGIGEVFLKLNFYGVEVLPICMSVRHMHARCPGRPEMSFGSLRIRVTNHCEPSCGCWESKLGPLEEEPLLSAAEKSFQPRG